VAHGGQLPPGVTQVTAGGGLAITRLDPPEGAAPRIVEPTADPSRPVRSAVERDTRHHAFP